MKDRIKKLLISGLKASEICSIVGCSPSYVSQLLKDEEFKNEVQAGMIATQTEKGEEEHIDTRYQTVEHRLLTAIEDKIPEATLGEVVRALDMVNKRRDDSHKRKNPALQQPAIQLNIVSLALPAQALRSIQAPVVEMNSQKEIIAIEGKPLAPMSSNGVKDLFAAITAKQQAVPAIPSVASVEEL